MMSSGRGSPQLCFRFLLRFRFVLPLFRSLLLLPRRRDPIRVHDMTSCFNHTYGCEAKGMYWARRATYVRVLQ